MGHLIALLPPVLLFIGVAAVGYRLVVGSRDDRRMKALLEEAKASGPSGSAEPSGEAPEGKSKKKRK